METIEDEIEMIKCRQLEILKAYKEVKKTCNVFERGGLKELNELAHQLKDLVTRGRAAKDEKRRLVRAILTQHLEESRVKKIISVEKIISFKKIISGESKQQLDPPSSLGEQKPSEEKTFRPEEPLQPFSTPDDTLISDASDDDSVSNLKTDVPVSNKVFSKTTNEKIQNSTSMEHGPLVFKQTLLMGYDPPVIMLKGYDLPIFGGVKHDRAPVHQVKDQRFASKLLGTRYDRDNPDHVLEPRNVVTVPSAA